jgi:phage terminase large subunit
MTWKMPEALEFLFQPSRYKVARGGRGSGKSWGFARALLIQGYQKPLRILCTREVQKSIKQSVHQLLKDQIEALGLSAEYEVLNAEIRGRNGTAIHFAGLSDMTADSIKSFEGVDRVWVEEGQSITARSWKILIPTIRKEGSEIWVSYNPELETDETHRRFVVEPPPDCVSVLMNWADNPWFPPVLEQERTHAKATMSQHEYRNVWEGECLPAVTGAIYFDEVAMLEREKRIREVPHDPLLKMHAIWDLGWNDSMSIILAQRQGSELRVIEYIEDSHRTLADYVSDLKQKRYAGQPVNWGNDYLPHDGFAKDFKTGKSAEEILKALGRSVQPIPKMDVEGGIKAARSIFSRLYLDKDKTARLVECLKRYRRQINQTTNEPGAPLHDEFSHGADAFRYLALCADVMSNDDMGGPLKYQSLGII